MSRASESIGLVAADDYVQALYGRNPGFERIYPPGDTVLRQGKPGDFDLVYKYGDDPPKFVVVEAKGGASKLGVKQVKKGKSEGLAEQGSSEYFDAIVENMADSPDPSMTGPGADLWAAGRVGVEYLHVEVPLLNDPTTPQHLRARKFDLTDPPDAESAGSKE